MNSSEQRPVDRTDDIDVVALMRVAWRYKFLIVGTAVGVTLVALYLAFTAEPVYRAEVVVAEVTDRNLGALDGQLGGLASLAGLNLQTSNAGQEAQAVLGSRRLVEEFISRNRLLPELFADTKAPPSLWFGVRRFRTLMAIDQDKRKGVTSITVDWKDPVVAARWANQLVALANELVRGRAQEESKRNIAYLQEQIGNTDVVEVRRVMYNLIENETKTLMLASGRAEYAFTTIDPAVAPEVRIKPRRTVMAILGASLGLLIGVVLAFGHNFLRQRQLLPA